MARCICSGMSTCFTSTLETLMPQGSVSVSRMTWSLALTLSRWERISSSSNWPTTLRMVVWASCEGVVLHLRKGQVGVHHAEITNGVYFHGDVVARDDVLRRNVERLNPHVDAVQCFYRPKNKIYAGALRLGY